MIVVLGSFVDRMTSQLQDLRSEIPAIKGFHLFIILSEWLSFMIRG